MLTLVEVINSRSNALQLPMLSAANGYVIRDIEGLDPVDATLTTSSMAQLDGAQPQNARRDTRNITMKIGLEPNFVSNTVDSLRAALYDWFMPKANINMKFHKDGSLFAVTSGQVESNQNVMFSADPEVDISIICYDPDFYAPAPVVASLDTTNSTDLHTFTYAGTSDAGMTIALSVDRDLDAFAIYNTTPDNVVQKFSVQGVGAFIAGDTVTINSIPGQKSLVRTRAGNKTSVLFYLDDGADWITFQKGDNRLRVFATGAAVPYTLTYTPQFGGL